MKKTHLLSEEKRNKILTKLEESPKKFVELKRILQLESNLLAYNLNLLIKENLVIKKGSYFHLSEGGKYSVAYISEYSDASKIPLPCIVVILKKGGKVLVRKKRTEPDKGKLSFIGHKLKQGRDIFEYAKEFVKKDLNLEFKNPRLICVNNYLIKNRDKVNAHYLVFFLRATLVGKAENSLLKNYKKIKGEMVPDNKFILQNMLNNKSLKFINSIYEESSKKFKVVSIY